MSDHVRTLFVALLGACLLALSGAAAAQASRCKPGPGATGSPRSIEQAVDLVNSLPKPVSVACFVQALDAPLKIHASKSVASLQLSMGPEDPRWFIFSLPLIISVTSAGPGAELIEFGVLQPGNKRALLGELRMPIDSKITHALPYDRIARDVGTSCGFFCHQNEERDPRITFTDAFISKSIRADPGSEVQIDFMRGVLQRCKSPTASARCELLHALLVTGRGQREDFPPDMPVGF